MFHPDHFNCQWEWKLGKNWGEDSEQNKYVDICMLLFCLEEFCKNDFTKESLKINEISEFVTVILFI